MTKRRGKGSRNQRRAKAELAEAEQLTADNLSPQESLALELQALRAGWLNGSTTFETTRQALLLKAATKALEKTCDDHLFVKLMRAIAQTEHREIQLRLQAAAITLRANGKGGGDDLPEQRGPSVTINNVHVSGQQSPAVDTVQAVPVFQVIQQLIAKREVRDAADRRPEHMRALDPVGPSPALQPQVHEAAPL